MAKNVSKKSTYKSINRLVKRLREDLEQKKYVLLYAYNGTGKTRLSMAFRDAGKKDDERDTLYFNAFTEDLFHWENDLENDTERFLRLNSNSRFFAGLKELEMETRVRSFLSRYADFNFSIDVNNWIVTFSREIIIQGKPKTIENIKVSRGEESIFVWCFFLSVVQLVIDGQGAYSYVKYIYIDDPVSSLDDNNVITVASHLAQILKSNERIKVVLSSHHTLFYNVMANELKKANKYFLYKTDKREIYLLKDTGDTPYFYHVCMLIELHRAAAKNSLYTYHFNILRNILEKTAHFHGFDNFSDCIRQDSDDPEGIIHGRMISVLNHGGHSVFEPKEMVEDNKKAFIKILNNFILDYKFNPNLFK